MSFPAPITSAPLFKQNENQGASLDTADLDAYLVLLRDTINQFVTRAPLSTNADGTPLSNTVSTATQSAVLASLAALSGAGLVGTNQPGANVEAALAAINAALTALTSSVGTTADIIRRTGAVAFTGNQSMGGNKLTNLANGTTAQDAVTYSQLQAVAASISAAADALRRDGSLAMTGPLSFGANKGTNLADGVASTDAATVGQVLTQLLARALTDGGGNTSNLNANAKKITNLLAGTDPGDVPRLDQVPTMTVWADGGAIPITAVTTNPAKGSVTRDKAWWRRVGDSIDLRYDFLYSTAGTAGSGDYLFALPGARQIDTAKISVYTGASLDIAVASAIGTVRGKNASGSWCVGWIVPYDATRFRILVGDPATTFAFMSNSWFGLSTLAGLNINATLPVTGWGVGSGAT